MAEATVLIVDDDRTIVRLCQRLLERASYQVITAMDPIEALKVLEHQRVDLLLSDIRMPIMDGFELITRAKQFQPGLPALVMTGYGSIDNAIQALHRGVDGLILKPFENTAELIQTVQRVLEESRQRRDAARMQVLRPLFDVTERLLAETSPQLLENLIINAVMGLFQATFAGIYRLNMKQTGLDVVRSTGQLKYKLPPELQQQLVDKMLAMQSPLVISTSGPGSTPEMKALLEQTSLETIMFVAVRRNNAQFIFCACRETGGALFTETDLEMFVILARQAGVAMENARLYSELKEYVRQVEESQRALIQAEKMAAVGRLMASLAHEINNPLQAVRNCLHLASRKGLETDQRLRYLDMTDSELERLVNTVRRMLDFYRPGGAEKELSDVHRVIDQVLGILGPQLREQGVQVTAKYTGENMLVHLVPDQIQQVLFNLVLNAMDALEETEPSQEAAAAREKEIWIDVVHEKHQVRIYIEDSGPGIPPAMQERIFEPFVSTKQNGTGLGLAVSFGIMERHQGSLSSIAPRYGDGACFEVILPLGVDTQDGKNLNR